MLNVALVVASGYMGYGCSSSGNGDPENPQIYGLWTRKSWSLDPDRKLGRVAEPD